MENDGNLFVNITVATIHSTVSFNQPLKVLLFNPVKVLLSLGCTALYKKVSLHIIIQKIPDDSLKTHVHFS